MKPIAILAIGAGLTATAIAFGGHISRPSLVAFAEAAPPAGTLQEVPPGAQPEVWTDPDTGCEYLRYGVAMVPRYTRERVRGCR